MSVNLIINLNLLIMRNLFLSVVLMFGFSYGFSMSKTDCSGTFVDAKTSTTLTISEPSEKPNCTIKIKGKINGVEVEVTVTVEGVSCSELLQQLTTNDK